MMQVNIIRIRGMHVGLALYDADASCVGSRWKNYIFDHVLLP